MPKDSSTVLHVVVGAGIIPHFRNAIESILTNTNDKVLAIYNSIDRRDSERFSHFTQSSEYGKRVEFRTLGNSGPSKTGSLYDAYNLAIDFAISEKFQYLNFVQSDCQLMWWSDALVVRLDEIFAATAGADGAGVLCVGTVFPVLGKFVDSNFKDTVEFDSGLNSFVHRGAGLADVGVFSVSAIQAASFRFVGTEAELQQIYSKQGYQVPLLDVPCVAFIPWPATVRKGKVTGTVIEPPLPEMPILRLIEGRSPEIGCASWGEQCFWMEDWVRPNGWNCLFPYWPTSIENPKWLKRRLHACQLLGLRPWATVAQVFNDVRHHNLERSIVPSFTDLAVGVVGGYLQGLIGSQPKILSFVLGWLRGIQ